MHASILTPTRASNGIDEFDVLGERGIYSHRIRKARVRHDYR